MREFMTESTSRNINFDYIFNEIRPITEYGIKCRREAKPFVRGQEEALQDELRKVEIFTEIKERRDAIDVLKHIKNISETIERAKNNQVLDEVELFEVKNFLLQVDKMGKSLRGTLISKYDDLTVAPIPELIASLDPAGEGMYTFYIYDEYSDRLKSIRKEKKETDRKIKSCRREIKEALQQKYEIKLNLRDEVTISKSDKVKIEALREDENLRVSGENYLSVIYSIKNNEVLDDLEQHMVELSAEEEDEEYTIRKKISGEIKDRYDQLLKNTSVIGRIDYCIAKANYAQKTRSVKPEITENLSVTIVDGRNLKLENTLKEKGHDYVPVSVSLNKNVTCITGANMGGKTVSLRMIGQVISAASYGMFVPCSMARLPLFDHICISVGDDQSIEKGLSTFGAEMVNLREAVSLSSQRRCLILIDELAGGTNPKEGYAITRAFVNYLKARDCITVLTTHYDNVANDADILNLQVSGLKIPKNTEAALREGDITVKDISEISKYMDYRLIEVKGRGSAPKDALRIARMAGVSDEIIRDAENYL